MGLETLSVHLRIVLGEYAFFSFDKCATETKSLFEPSISRLSLRVLKVRFFDSSSKALVSTRSRFVRTFVLLAYILYVPCICQPPAVELIRAYC